MRSRLQSCDWRGPVQDNEHADGHDRATTMSTHLPETLDDLKVSNDSNRDLHDCPHMNSWPTLRRRPSGSSAQVNRGLSNLTTKGLQGLTETLEVEMPVNAAQ
jgi:hypothetical protein